MPPRFAKVPELFFYIETFDVQRFHQDLRNACFFSLRCATVAVITNFHPQFLGSSVRVGMAGMSYRHLAEQHAARVKFLSTVLYEHLVSPDDGDFLSRTGSLVRCRNLHNKKNRKTFHDLVAASQEYLYGDKTAPFWTFEGGIGCHLEWPPIRLSNVLISWVHMVPWKLTFLGGFHFSD